MRNIRPKNEKHSLQIQHHLEILSASVETARRAALAVVRPTLTLVAMGLLIAIIPAGAIAAYSGHTTHRDTNTSRPAHAAHTLNATDTAHLHYIRSSGSLLIEEGSATGNLPGTMRAHVNIGPTVVANFTIYTQRGTIIGHGTATPHGSGIYESFGGSILVTNGTGRYAHASGHAGFYGTFNRRTYALVVQTTGHLSY
jgi:hypothetical protein